MKTFLLSCVAITAVLGQGPLDPAALLKPLGESWPTYSGDYSGKRFSSLTQINQANVKNLTLSWVGKVTPGPGGGGGGGGRGGFGPGAAPVITGGEGTGEAGGGFGGASSVRSSILQVNGVLYFSMPDNAWAMDAVDGHEIWHYYW